VLLYESMMMMERIGAAILPFEEHDNLTFEEFLRLFRWFGASTVAGEIDVATDAGGRVRVKTFTNEFWTAKQRAAHSLHEIVADLRAQGLNLTQTGFQQTVLAQSRDGDYFIGSGRRGYFLIETQLDAEEMRDFYQERIRAEQQNLDNLRRQAGAVGWNI
jgi:hypothetical protein